MEYLEHGLSFWAGTLKLILEGISLFCILLGLLSTAQIVLIQNRRLRGSPSALANIRINFGRWLSVALEFQLGADIVNTTVAPSFEALGKLGLIAVIRTFLNYFLTRELAEEIKVTDQNQHPLPLNTTEN
jgi:uncharacterized membrane protein